MIYIASPYTHPDPHCVEERFWLACRYASHLMKSQTPCFSPIAHSHSVAMCGDVPADWDTWRPWCLEMLGMCDRVHVLTLPGWQQSVGVMAEINEAKALEMPVVFIDSETYERT